MILIRRSRYLMTRQMRKPIYFCNTKLHKIIFFFQAEDGIRDPTLLRIIDKPHPIHKDKYRVWPNYDLAVAIEDSIDGVTHAFRTKEYELRNELYYVILDRLGMRKPEMLVFSRLEFDGMPVSKRVLKSLVEEGK